MSKIFKVDTPLLTPQRDTPKVSIPMAADMFNREDGPLGVTSHGGYEWYQMVANVEIRNRRMVNTSSIGSTGALWAIEIENPVTKAEMINYEGIINVYVGVSPDISSGYLFGRGLNNVYRLSTRTLGSNLSHTTVSAPEQTSPEKYSLEFGDNNRVVCKVNDQVVIDVVDDTHPIGGVAGVRFVGSGNKAGNFAVHSLGQ